MNKKRQTKTRFLEKARFVKYTPERVSSVTKKWLCHAIAPALVHRP
jgi:hypothetical protein